MIVPFSVAKMKSSPLKERVGLKTSPVGALPAGNLTDLLKRPSSSAPPAVPAPCDEIQAKLVLGSRARPHALSSFLSVLRAGGIKPGSDSSFLFPPPPPPPLILTHPP